MQEFEKLGAFYLGRPFDLNEKKPKVKRRGQRHGSHPEAC